MNPEYLKIINQSELFIGYESHELMLILGCLNAQIKEYQKNQMVFSQGTVIDKIGIVITGTLQLQQTDLFGNNNILTSLGSRNIFGESYAGSGLPIPIEVVASQESTVLFIDYEKIIHPCTKNCIDHSNLVTMMVRLLSIKNMFLTEKIAILSKRTTREKLLHYLNGESKRHQAKTFTIPFNRQGLADYLVVDRSAMSAELSKLKKEGIIEYHKSTFRVLS